MTRKDYIAIAEVIKDDADYYGDASDAKVALREVAGALCDVFERGNHMFDRARFLKACGFSDDQ